MTGLVKSMNYITGVWSGYRSAHKNICSARGGGGGGVNAPYDFFFVLFFVVACLSAQRAVMSLMIILLPHMYIFGGIFEVGGGGGKCVGVPPPPPPPPCTIFEAGGGSYEAFCPPPPKQTPGAAPESRMSLPVGRSENDIMWNSGAAPGYLLEGGGGNLQTSLCSPLTITRPMMSVAHCDSPSPPPPYNLIGLPYSPPPPCR